MEYIEKFLNTVVELATSYAFKIILALIIIAVGLKLVKFIIKLVNKTKSYTGLDDAVKSFLNSFIKILLYVVIFISAATTLGVPATSFITILASCGLAIGMALQGSLSNLAGGIMILIFKPFKMGDYIISGGFEGTVKEINILYTKLTTPDNKNITIPNGTISNSPVVDVTGNDKRRVDINLGVSYNSDTQTVIETLIAIGESCEYALSEPAPVAAITGYADSAINVSLRIWVKTENYWKSLCYLNEKVKEKIDDKTLDIPYPQMDVHIKNN